MTFTKRMSRKAFAAKIVKQLKSHNISCVLVGGACLSIYTDNRHESLDLDFISPHSIDSIEAALAEVGFEREGRYFRHSSAKFYVEFPTGPVAIGHKVPVKPEGKFRVDGTVVNMLSPTQCVMDRLAAWFHWNDRRSLIHALWVCEKQPVNLSKIKAWALKENEREKFETFLAEFKKLKSKKR